MVIWQEKPKVKPNIHAKPDFKACHIYCAITMCCLLKEISQCLVSALVECNVPGILEPRTCTLQCNMSLTAVMFLDVMIIIFHFLLTYYCHESTTTSVTLVAVSAVNSLGITVTLGTQWLQ